MKDLESQARLIRGNLADAAPAVPHPAPSRHLEASRAYHTSLRMLGLHEIARSGLMNQVHDARAQGPSDALVLAVKAIRQSSAPHPSEPIPLVPLRPPASSARASFRNLLHRQLHPPRSKGEPS